MRGRFFASQGTCDLPGGHSMFGTSDLRWGHPIWQGDIRCLGMFQRNIRIARGTFHPLGGRTCAEDLLPARVTYDLPGGHSMFGTSDLRGIHPILQGDIRCLGMFQPPRGHTICSGDVPTPRGPNLRGRFFASRGDIPFARGTFDVWDIRSARGTSDLAGGHPMFGNFFTHQGDIRFARGTFYPLGA